MRTLVSLSIALCLLGVSRASALDLQKFEKLVVFGDSLSDDGNLFALTDGAYPPPPYGKAFDGISRNSPGRFTDGEIWVDYFPSVAQHFPPLTAYFQDPFSKTATDFAIGSATSADLLEQDPAGFPAEIPTYLAATGGSAPANNLYVIWIGVNDFVPGASPEVTVENIRDGILRLAQAGAKSFVVINLPDLSLTPNVRGSGSASVQAAKEFVFGVNVLLEADLPLLALTHSITIDLVDINPLFVPLVLSPARFGFTNSTDSAFNTTTGAIVPDPNHYVFWDGFHPTTNAHYFAAEYIFGVVSFRWSRLSDRVIH